MRELIRTFIKEHIGILIILLVAVLLRFYHLVDIPFTHDELSTLFRTYYTSFDDLIKMGVIGDTHPAGLQVFVYYFKMIFGSEEWVIKIPFLLFGLVSIWLVYVIYSKWYNKTLGLISASFLATLQYTVMYSQIARPYISGMFFVLALVYFWNALFIEKKQHWSNYVGYVLMADLCLYNHHFSALMAVIISVTGLFFADRRTSWKYLLAGLGIVFLYLPHLSILHAQLALKGLGWVSKPTILFVRDYFCYLGQFSWITLVLCVGLIGISFIRFQKRVYFSKITLISLVWFVLPFAIGYLYSVYRSPLLQYSVLIFSFPFLFPVLFGGIQRFSNRINLVLVVLILCINSTLLIFHRKHYTLFYHSIYKAFVLDEKNVAHDKPIVLFDAHHTNKDMVAHYLKKWKVTYDYRWVNSFKNSSELSAYLKEMSKTYPVLYLGSIGESLPNLIPIIQEYYPTLVKRKDYISGSTFVFSKGKSTTHILTSMQFNKDEANWQQLNKYANYLQSGHFFMDSTLEYSLSYSGFLNELVPEKYDIMDVSLRIKVPSNSCSASIVTTIDTPNGPLDWRSTNFSDFVDSTHVKSEWIVIKHSTYLTDEVRNTSNAKLSVYVWNANKEAFLVDDIQITLRKENPVRYGLYYPVP